jgi:hypothetical protein
MSNDPTVKLNVRVECEKSNRCDGAWWRILEVVDEDGECLGDCGVYEYDAMEDFPRRIIEYVLDVFDEFRICDDESANYELEIRLMDGTTSLGWAVEWFRKQHLVERRSRVADEEE